MEPLKKSYYTIISDPINDHNTRILFSTRTSKSILLDQHFYDMYEADDFDLLDNGIRNKLIELSLLVAKDEDELAAIIKENKKSIEDDTLMYEIVQPTAMCQLGCDYCGQLHNKVNLAPAIYQKIIDRFRIESSCIKVLSSLRESSLYKDFSNFLISIEKNY